MSTSGQNAPATLVLPDKNEQPFLFLDLKAQFATIRNEVMDAVAGVLESQHFILGSEVHQFEREVAEMLGVEFAVSCASGSDALVLAMMALGIGHGDEVITTPFTFFATAGSIARVGAKPVFVDIEPETFNLDPAKIKAAITPKTRALLPVHLFGLPVDLAPILRIAEECGLAVIEDAAQAIGATYNAACVGTFGTFGCFSFFPSKNLGGAGDGGLVTTRDRSLADKLRILRVHGSAKKYHHEILGLNSRLDTLQAAILRIKLKHLASWTAMRRERAELYRRLFHEAQLADHIQVPIAASATFLHVYNQFSICCKDRNALREFLRERQIPTEVYYPQPLHLQPAFAYLGNSPGQFPEAERASSIVLSLPVYPELSSSQQEAVVSSISAFYRSRN